MTCLPSSLSVSAHGFALIGFAVHGASCYDRSRVRRFVVETGSDLSLFVHMAGGQTSWRSPATWERQGGGTVVLVGREAVRSIAHRSGLRRGSGGLRHAQRRD